MASSEFTFYLRHDPAQLGGADPVDVGQARYLVNNVNHLADVAGQVWIDYRPHATSHFREPAIASTSEFKYIVTYGPFLARLRPDGSPYPLRCALCGKSQQGDNVTFRLAIGLNREIRDLVESGDASQCLEASTTSMNHGWLGTSVPGGSASTLIELPSSHEYMTEYTAESALAAGDPVSVRVAEVYVGVYGKTANVASKPHLSGLYVAEYVGL